MYQVEVIRDRIRTFSDFPRGIQNIIIGYTVCIGDLLCYMTRVFPHVDRTCEPFEFYPPSAIGFICCSIQDDHIILSDIRRERSLLLYAEDDPFDHLIQKIMTNDPAIYSYDYVLEMRDHVNKTVDICMRHLLRS